MKGSQAHSGLRLFTEIHTHQSRGSSFRGFESVGAQIAVPDRLFAGTAASSPITFLTFSLVENSTNFRVRIFQNPNLVHQIMNSKSKISSLVLEGCARILIYLGFKNVSILLFVLDLMTGGFQELLLTLRNEVSPVRSIILPLAGYMSAGFKEVESKGVTLLKLCDKLQRDILIQ